MLEIEKIYGEKCQTCKDVEEPCYMGTKNCHTCAHRVDYDSKFRQVEGEYCSISQLVSSKEIKNWGLDKNGNCIILN